MNTMPWYYDKLKQLDYDAYYRAVLFSSAITDNAKQMRQNRAHDLEIESYMEQEIMKYTLYLLEMRKK